MGMYYRVGVQRYVLVDRGPRGEAPAQLRGYERDPGGWQPAAVDAQGRLSLALLPLLLGLEGARPWLYEAATGRRLPDLTEVVRGLTDAEAKTRDAAEARAALEERLRDLEEQLRRQQDQT